MALREPPRGSEGPIRDYTKSSNYWNRFIVWSDDILDFLDNYEYNSFERALVGTAAFIPIGFAKNRLFIFKVNPQRMSVKRRKTNKVQLTAGGPEVTMGKEEMSNYSLKATTGPLMPPHYMFREGVRDQWFSSNWRRFETFQRFWEEYSNKSEILHMIFDREYTKGHITDFGYDRNADEPWQIEMDMNYIVYPDSRRSLMTMVPTPFLEMHNIADAIVNPETEYW